ncbi:hypothetical protein [Brachyspira sp.]|uniref:hypothetical protein n=1 Tax=Brachyspira sp. TaxID=1977261 RepID=UPI002623C6F0|nr:hypothetical protein [Brachyspira sp.]
MNKYILIHRIINTSIFMLFPIGAFYIIEHAKIKAGIYGLIFITVNIIEILLFISFLIVSSRCEWGTRKQHAFVKAGISLIIYLMIIIMAIISIF